MEDDTNTDAQLILLCIIEINVYHFSIYQICVKYKKEWTTRKAVDDNKESMMDGEFLDLQMEKSTEGLSESSVQFMLQAVFFVSLIILAVYSVIEYLSLHKYFGKCL